MTAGPQAIVFVITQLDAGGAERALTQLVLRLDKSRFQPTVISLRPRPVGARAILVEQLEAAGVAVEFLNALQKWEFPRAVWRLSRRLQELRPAVVQSFLFHANVVTALAGKLSGVPVVAGMRVADPSRTRQRVERWLAPLIKMHICVSQSVADFYQKTVGISRDKLDVIPNGVDVERFAQALPVDRSSLPVPANRRLLVAIGRLERQKGHDWLLPILAKAFEELPEQELLLVGDGPDRGRLQQQASELGIGDRVHFLGWRSDVPELLRGADLLLLPSRWEGMPNVLLEAMAAGLPVLTTRVEGTTEILGPLATEQSVAVGDSAAFEDAIVRLCQDRVLSAELGQSNRERVLASFSLAVMTQAYEQIYMRLMKS
ncbi:glycosyltransferase [Anatilimnocola sp. NA78]|uniref:glycosyltransferase n=1 Tax=Anatilimnocola sp. NA78 TaxID=3415683 RepID=UPI003CE571D4